jgi:hypothetical protein
MATISSLKRATVGIAVCLISSALACSGDSTTSPPDVSGSKVIEPLMPFAVQGIAGSVIDAEPAIRLKDKRTGQPLAGVTVQFITSGGYVDNQLTKTDAAGIATAGKWTLGPSAVKQTLTVNIAGMKTAFTADVKPDVPALISVTSQSQVALVGEMVDPILIVVTDRYQNPVPGVTVRFAITEGQGALSTSSAVTDSHGATDTGRWKVGAGNNTVLARADGIEGGRTTVFGLDPSTVTYFAIDSVRRWTKVYAPEDMGVSRATLAITKFDECLCRPSYGYYILDVYYAGSESRTRITGGYTIDPPQLSVRNNNLESFALVNGRFEVTVNRVDPDSGDGWWETWIFRPSS